MLSISPYAELAGSRSCAGGKNCQIINLISGFSLLLSCRLFGMEFVAESVFVCTSGSELSADIGLIVWSYSCKLLDHVGTDEILPVRCAVNEALGGKPWVLPILSVILDVVSHAINLLLKFWTLPIHIMAIIFVVCPICFL